MKIAILGATGHIGLNLIKHFCRSDNYELILFCRSADKARRLLTPEFRNNRIALLETDLNRVLEIPLDVIINCVGYGDPAAVMTAGIELFRLTEHFDNQVLARLEREPDTRYIHFSSGAVYGTGFEKPVQEGDTTTITVNNIQSVDYYRIAKLNAEAKHRACSRLNIIDLRVFSFFSRYIDLSARFLISEMIVCLKHNTPFQTSESDIVRDFLSPEDLFDLTVRCCNNQRINAAFDAFSLKPVTKMEMLQAFSDRYGLQYQINPKLAISDATGKKRVYVSENRSAQRVLNYQPTHTSMETLLKETDDILG